MVAMRPGAAGGDHQPKDTGASRMRPGSGAEPKSSESSKNASAAASQQSAQSAKQSRMTPDSLRKGSSEGGASSAATRDTAREAKGESVNGAHRASTAGARGGSENAAGSSSAMGMSGVFGPHFQDSGKGGRKKGGSDKVRSDGTPAPEKKPHHVRNAAGAAAAVPVANAAGQMLVFLMLLKWLKGLIMAVAAAVANFIGAVVGFFVGTAKAVWGAAMAVGNFVSGVVGGAVSAGTAAVASVAASVAAVGVGASMVAGAVIAPIAMRDETNMAAIDCGSSADAQIEAVADAGGGDASAKTEENAKMVYSILAGWGMPKENVAGILGNWDAESRVDPTSVEGIFDEPFRLGEKKKAAEKAGFGGFGNVAQRGIGFGQWTNDRNLALTKYAKEHGGRWEDPKMQLVFMISDAEGSNAQVIKDMIKDSKGSPASAAVHFHNQWERSADSSMDLRRSNAEKWMGKLGGWKADKELADSLLAQASTSLDTADAQSVAKTRQNCRAASDNLTIAKGGLNMEQATKLMDLYRKEGNSFLTGRYGSGGPGACGSDKADNCVSFSTYFANKYTELQEYAPGNGVDTASAMAAKLGKKTSHTPKPYSVASGAASGGPGHTFVVLGIEGDNAIIGEASYCSHHELTHAKKMSMKELTSGAWEFVDLSDKMLPEDKIHKS